MRFKHYINISAVLSVLLVLVLGTLVFFQISLHPSLIKLLFFSGFSSVILLLIHSLLHYCKTCSESLKKMLSIIGLSVIGLGSITFFGLFGANTFWNITLGIAIIYSLIIQLQLLGWADNKQKISNKITFLLALISNLFLAFVFIFKVPYVEFKYFIFSASLVSILIIFYGLYYYQNRISD